MWEKMSVFEAATRTPLIIRAPWLPNSIGAVSTHVVEVVSLYRTLAELAGLAHVEASVQGRSFAALLRGDSDLPGDGSSPGAAVATGQGVAPEPPVGVALSQMTRCAKSTANATLATGCVALCKTTARCHCVAPASNLKGCCSCCSLLAQGCTALQEPKTAVRCGTR